jgi:hypothetical protein
VIGACVSAQRERKVACGLEVMLPVSRRYWASHWHAQKVLISGEILKMIMSDSLCFALQTMDVFQCPIMYSGQHYDSKPINPCSEIT